MKYLFFYGLLFCFTQVVFAQSKTANTVVEEDILSYYPTVYYSYYGFLTTKEFGAYKGVVTTENNEFVVTITDTVTNIKRAIERFSDKELTLRTGNWQEYDEKGRVFTTQIYANNKEQDHIEYDSLGKVYEKYFYNKNVVVRTETYYPDGKINYLTDCETIHLSRTKKMRPDGSIIYLKTANRGLCRFKFLDKNGQETAYDSTEVGKEFHRDKNGLLFGLQNNPAFMTGEQGLMNYIKVNIEYPKIAMDNHISGLVLVYFTVNASGELEKLVASSYPHPALMREAIRIVKAMPKWKPATLNGKPVAARFILPVRFSWNGE
jgi:TonB family protein